LISLDFLEKGPEGGIAQTSGKRKRKNDLLRTIKALERPV